MSTSFGQNAPRVRSGGRWVDAEAEEGVGPKNWDRVEAADAEDQTDGEAEDGAEDEDDGGETETEDLSKLNRADLDKVAESRGLDPTDYSNKQDLLNALQ